MEGSPHDQSLSPGTELEAPKPGKPTRKPACLRSVEGALFLGPVIEF